MHAKLSIYVWDNEQTWFLYIFPDFVKSLCKDWIKSKLTKRSCLTMLTRNKNMTFHSVCAAGLHCFPPVPHFITAGHGRRTKDETQLCSCLVCWKTRTFHETSVTKLFLLPTSRVVTLALYERLEAVFKQTFDESTHWCSIMCFGCNITTTFQLEA